MIGAALPFSRLRSQRAVQSVGAFSVRGTDTVPQMLSPGETVLSMAQQHVVHAHAIDTKSFAAMMKWPNGGIDVMIREIQKRKPRA